MIELPAKKKFLLLRMMGLPEELYLLMSIVGKLAEFLFKHQYAQEKGLLECIGLNGWTARKQLLSFE